MLILLILAIVATLAAIYSFVMLFIAVEYDTDTEDFWEEWAGGSLLAMAIFWLSWLVSLWYT